MFSCRTRWDPTSNPLAIAVQRRRSLGLLLLDLTEWLAAPVLLRDIARAMKSTAPPPEPWQREVVLVLSLPQGGVKGLIREFALLYRSLWETLLPRHALPAKERQAVERCFDEALAADLSVRLGRSLAGADSKAEYADPSKEKDSRARQLTYDSRNYPGAQGPCGSVPRIGWRADGDSKSVSRALSMLPGRCALNDFGQAIVLVSSDSH